MIAYTAASIFTGHQWLQGHGVLTEDNMILDVLPAEELPSDCKIVGFNPHVLVPAFIDIQIYGAGEKLFAVYPEDDALNRLYNYCKQGGAHHFLPTVATNQYDVFYRCIDAVKTYWSNGGKGVIGLHIEGPWINAIKRGAHIEQLIHSPSIQQAKALLDYGKGVIKMITLAPEVCSKEVIELVQSYGVIVSAGHSNAVFAEATAAFDNGITTATHLYNAMSPLLHRAPGMVGAVLNHPTATASIIPDGHHSDFAAVAIAKKIMGARLFMITDAVTETSIGPYLHKRQGDKYVSEGILSGSALTMMQGVQNCIHKIGIHLDEALRMASMYPAKVIGLGGELGSIAKGYRADMLVVDDQLAIHDHITK